MAKGCGEVTEWLKVHAWKACVRKYRGFESLLLRHKSRAVCNQQVTDGFFLCLQLVLTSPFVLCIKAIRRKGVLSVTLTHVIFSANLEFRFDSRVLYN
jgi:hypothetical protein